MSTNQEVVTQSLLSIVIPVFNEEDNVVLLTQKIHESLNGYTYEIVFVNDFSTDETVQRIKKNERPACSSYRIEEELRSKLGISSRNRLR